MSSQYQQELQALKASACPKCGGGGRIDDADFGDTYYNEWQCGTCKGSGFAPRAAPETRPECKHDNLWVGDEQSWCADCNKQV